MPKNPHIAEQLPPKPKTVFDEVQTLFDAYLDTTSAIIEDYVPDPGMLIELAEADKNFKEEIAALEEEQEEPEFEKLLLKIKQLDPTDIDTDKLLALCDPGYAMDWASQNGYAIIKLTTLQQRTKLEEFVTKELYPDYNERGNYNI